ncbi:MAG: phage minor head protein [Planctomycetia bacterium]|nr:phage minor head protein [Planctomycetia bacterium]
MLRLREAMIEAVQSGYLGEVEKLLQTELLDILNAQTELAFLKGGRRTQLTTEKKVLESAVEFQSPIRFSIKDEGTAKSKGVAEYLKKVSGMNPTDAMTAFEAQNTGFIKGLSEDVCGAIHKISTELTQKQIHVSGGKKEVVKALREAGLGELTPPHSVETILRTQSMQAYSAGEWAAARNPLVEKNVWGFEYVTVGDDRVRAEHRLLNGVRLPKDDPFWLKFFPPNGWNCRCSTITITKWDDEASVSFGVTGRDPRTRTDSELGLSPEFAGNPGMLASPSPAPLKPEMQPKAEIPEPPEPSVLPPEKIPAPKPKTETTPPRPAQTQEQEPISLEDFNPADFQDSVKKVVEQQFCPQTGRDITVKTDCGQVVFLDGRKKVNEITLAQREIDGKMRPVYVTGNIAYNDLQKAIAKTCEDLEKNAYVDSQGKAISMVGKIRYHFKETRDSEWVLRCSSAFERKDVEKLINQLCTVVPGAYPPIRIQIKRVGEKLNILPVLHGQPGKKQWVVEKIGKLYKIKGEDGKKYPSLDDALKSVLGQISPSWETRCQNGSMGIFIVNEKDVPDVYGRTVRPPASMPVHIRKKAAENFVSCPTLERAEDYAWTMGIEANYKNFTIREANETNRRLSEFLKVFPEAGCNRIRKMTSSETFSVKEGDNADYYYFERTIRINGLNFSENLPVLLKDRREKLWKEGWFSTPDEFGTVLHEMGHSLENLIREKGLDVYRKWVKEMGGLHERLLDADEPQELLSRYGRTSISEMLAESAAEYVFAKMNKTKPRELCVEVIELWKKYI